MEAKLDYVPRPQFEAFHRREQRFSCVVAHRRAGKTVACVNELVARALLTEKADARFAYIAPLYRQAKDVAWTYLKHAAQPFVAGPSEIRESELRVRLVNGNWITLYGSDNPDSLRGLYLDGAILDEFGDCRPSLWAEVVLPTLTDRQGWAVFIGTPKGRNHFWQVYERSKKDPSWFSMTLKASESGLLSPSDIAEVRSQLTEEQYRQEFEADFSAAVEGTYYASLIGELETSKHIRPVEGSLWDPAQPVYAACDLGFSDSTAFWFWQHRPDGIAVIDYEEDAGKPLIHYLELLVDKPYRYATIYLPHDARAKTLQTGRSTVEQVLDYFSDTDVHIDITPSLKLQHGIDAARMVLPHCHIDYTACETGVEALRHYRRRYDELNKQFSDKPLHDWSSHGADAFRYLALVARMHLPKQKIDQNAVKLKQIRSGEAFKPAGYSLDDLWDSRKPARFSFERMRNG